LHRELGATLAASGAALVIAVSGDAALFADAARERGIPSHFAADSERALEHALALVRPGDIVLVKASRGVCAEKVVDGLVAARGRAA
jgi:UDP-N-acetylmuramoyl-tripeptide--D-alanyl-D-alanine ligase